MRPNQRKQMKHIHHIVPKHMGGTDDPSNLIELSVEEHAEEHRKLYENCGNELDRIAYEALSGMIGKEEVIKKVLSESGKRGGSKGKGRIAWNKGKKMWSEEEKKRISENKKGKVLNLSEEGREKLRETGKKNKGRKRSEEFCETQSKRLKGKKQSKKQAEQSRKNAIGNKSRVGQKKGEEELKKLSDTLKAKYASGEMIHWTKRPEHAHRFKNN